MFTKEQWLKSKGIQLNEEELSLEELVKNKLSDIKYQKLMLVYNQTKNKDLKMDLIKSIIFNNPNLIEKYSVFFEPIKVKYDRRFIKRKK